jgi:hypothetical protein
MAMNYDPFSAFGFALPVQKPPDFTYDFAPGANSPPRTASTIPADRPGRWGPANQRFALDLQPAPAVQRAGKGVREDVYPAARAAHEYQEMGPGGQTLQDMGDMAAYGTSLPVRAATGGEYGAGDVLAALSHIMTLGSAPHAVQANRDAWNRSESRFASDYPMVPKTVQALGEMGMAAGMPEGFGFRMPEAVRPPEYAPPPTPDFNRLIQMGEAARRERGPQLPMPDPANTLWGLDRRERVATEERSQALQSMMERGRGQLANELTQPPIDQRLASVAAQLHGQLPEAGLSPGGGVLDDFHQRRLAQLSAAMEPGVYDLDQFHQNRLAQQSALPAGFGAPDMRMPAADAAAQARALHMRTLDEGRGGQRDPNVLRKMREQSDLASLKDNPTWQVLQREGSIPATAGEFRKIHGDLRGGPADTRGRPEMLNSDLRFFERIGVARREHGRLIITPKGQSL